MKRREFLKAAAGAAAAAVVPVPDGFGGVSISAADAEFIAHRAFDIAEINQLFGVPLTRVEIAGKDVTYRIWQPLELCK